MRGRMQNIVSMVLSLVGLALIGLGGVCLGDGPGTICDPPSNGLANRCLNTACSTTSVLCKSMPYSYAKQHPQVIGTCIEPNPPEPDAFCDGWEAYCPTDFYNTVNCASDPDCSDDIPEPGCFP
jgi:hypothetical protein